MRRAFTLIELLVVVAIVVILAAILLPVLEHTHCDDRRASCAANLKQIALGLSQYSRDYQEKWPPVAVGLRAVWAQALQPYTKSWPLFQCPSAPKGAPATTDYFLNSRLSARKITALRFPARTVLAGDGRDDSPADAALSHLPREWRGDPKSPAMRHHGNQGANYAFADGHVKFFQPELIASQPPARGTLTFAVR